MRERKVTNRQIFDVLRNGKGIDGPHLDKYGDWRIKLKRYSKGIEFLSFLLAHTNKAKTFVVHIDRACKESGGLFGPLYDSPIIWEEEEITQNAIKD